ncbi:hypothetical protein [Streptomyces sp. NRRL S-340]|uniref:hypothetical protein n=1 Tax=Streptomyces sp. NRRL S-340 TaxID=1463901 RepID=UPI00056BC2A9|nr:hypothetical protein [Streptomyces sp. NRRL S-340]
MRIRGRRLRFTAVLAVVVLALTGFSRGHGHGGHGSGGSGGCSSSRQDHDTSSSSSSSSSGGGAYGSGTDGTYAPHDDDTYGSGGSGTGTTGGSSHHRRRPDRGPTATPSGGTGSQLQAARARLLSCATEKKPYATVELTNPNDRRGTFTATVTFQDAHGGTIRSALQETDVPANGRRTVRVDAGAPGDVARPAHCTVDPAAPATG